MGFQTIVGKNTTKVLHRPLLNEDSSGKSNNMKCMSDVRDHTLNYPIYMPSCMEYLLT